jgi:hypothetical protein
VPGEPCSNVKIKIYRRTRVIMDLRWPKI